MQSLHGLTLIPIQSLQIEVFATVMSHSNSIFHIQSARDRNSWMFRKQMSLWILFLNFFLGVNACGTGRNRRITSVRNVVERAFGRLKNKFKMVSFKTNGVSLFVWFICPFISNQSKLIQILKERIYNARIGNLEDITKCMCAISNAFCQPLFKDSELKWRCDQKILSIV